MSKGSKRRPEDSQRFRENFDSIFGPVDLSAFREARDILNAQPVPTEGRKVYPADCWPEPLCALPELCACDGCLRNHGLPPRQ